MSVTQDGARSMGARPTAESRDRLFVRLRRASVALVLPAVLGLVACGGGGDESPAVAQADKPVQAAAQKPTFVPNVPIPADASTRGMWSPVYSWPLVSVHATLLPDGRVLTFGSSTSGVQTGSGTYDIWDSFGSPGAGHLTLPNGTGTDIFCSASILVPPADALSTPNVFIAGGDIWTGTNTLNTGNSNTTLLNVGNNSLTRGGEMNRARWYPTATTLVNGEIYIQGGRPGSDRPEVRTRAGGFRLLSNVDTDWLDDYYPRNFVAPDGRVFGYDVNGKMYFVNPAGTGSMTAAFALGTLPVANIGVGSSPVMFRPGRILHIGGNSNGAIIIDVNSGSPVVSSTNSLSTQRQYVVATLLADGKVLATGGSRVQNELDGVNNSAEIWNPQNGQWMQGPSATQPRLYHGNALLLPDASVLVTGGGVYGPVNNLNAEVYYPPYLFTAGGQRAVRPEVTTAPAWLEIGQTFTVEVASASAISRATLVKTGSATHAMNMDQRFLDLPFSATGSTLKIQAPTRAAEATPGYYHLFLFNQAGVPSVSHIVRLGVAAIPNPSIVPVVTNPGARSGQVGTALNLQIAASDPNGDVLAYSAAGLPPGLSINAQTGLVSGSPTTAGSFNVVVSVTDGINSASANFVWSITQPDGLVLAPLPPPVAVLANGAATFTASATGVNPRYRWDFGDGTQTAYSASASATHTYAAPGTYSVTLTVTDDSDTVISRSFLQTVYLPATSGRPAASTNLLLETPPTGNPRLWVVNQDNDSVSVFDAVTRAKLAEVGVGSAPRSIARAPDGSMWVTNKLSASITVIDANNRTVLATLALPRASQPFGIAVSPTAPQAFVALEAAGLLLKIDTQTRAVVAQTSVGPNPRQVSITANGANVYVSRFVTPPLPGEGTANVSTPASAGAEVVVLAAGSLATLRTIVLRHGDKPDQENQGRGIPNYLGAAVISPDGTQAWVPSKQDNVKRGTLRDGAALNFQSTVRAISSRIVLATGEEDTASRVDHDNASLASTAIYDPRGVYLFVALETSREVAVIGAHGGNQIVRINVGRAPQGLALSADGKTLYVSNFMDRTVGVYDLRPLVDNGVANTPLLATLSAVATERLSPTVLLGKQLFYDARDSRLSRDSYMSCASCHNDGGHDGRVWDFTGQGEGLRNTIALRGRAGMAQGRLHWGANFDEVQDFEGQIRMLAGGTGLMSDAAYLAGTRSQPLGTTKAGQSADLDALAAYVGSLNSFAPNPNRAANGALSAAAAAGRDVFAAQGCASCHGGTAFSGSGSVAPANVGTIKPSSGQTLGAALTGIDIPTLRDLWTTAPYLHDGSAASVEAAVRAHNTVSQAGLSDVDLASLGAYLREIGSEETVAPGSPVGSLTATASAAVTAVNLSTEGPADWAHWGDGVPGLVRKAGVAAQISAYTLVGGGPAVAYGNDLRPMSWTGGAPTAAATNRITGVYIAGQNTGFSITVPADTTQRIVKLYVGGWNSSGRLLAELTDGSAASYTDTSAAVGGQYGRTYTLTYSAASAGQQLRLTWTQASTTGNVTLNGAALSVVQANQPPVLTAPAAQTSTVNQAVTLAVSATDPNGDTLSWSATGLPPGLSIGAATGAISGTPTAVGSYTPNVVVQDGRGGSANASFGWTVQAPANRPPVLTAPAAQTTTVDQAVTLGVQASDPDGDTLAWSATGLPPGLAIGTTTGVIGGTATTVGNYTPNVVVQDGQGGSANASFGWTVQATAPVNNPPVLTVPAAQTTTVNQAVTLAVQASDPDADGLSFSATGLPGGLSIAAATGVISGTPTAAGSFTVNLAVQDARGATATGAFAWTVQPAVPAGGSLSGAVSAAATAANLSAEGPLDWAHWGDGVPGLVRKAGVAAQISAYTIVGTGPATAYPNDLRPISWTGGTPTAAATNLTTGLYIPGQNNGFTLTVPADTTQRTVKLYVGGWNSSARLVAQLSDASAANYTDTTAQAAGQYTRVYTLTYSAASAGQTLRLTWTQAGATAGNVTLNGAALAGAVAANQPPSITSPAAQNSQVGQAVTLGVAATDPDGDTLSYAATGLPPGLSIAAGSGVISGSPTTVGTYGPNVVVQDGRGGSANASFSWTVQATAPVNRPPVLTTPAAQTTPVNQSVNLGVVASDPDGDVLTYSASGLPPGLSVGVGTGVISGAPTTAGSYTVGLAVQDSKGATVTGSFGWTVQAAPVTGSLTGAVSAAVTAVNLTTEGSLDWTHWGDGVPGLVRKAGVAAQISAYTIVGAGPALAYGNDPRPISWTGGAPTAAATNSATGLYVPGQNNGFTLTVPADTTTRTVKLYVGGWNSSGRLVAQLSDGSAANYTQTTAQAAGQYSRTYTITYRAAAAGQQLRLTWTQTNATTGNVTLNGAALR